MKTDSRRVVESLGKMTTSVEGVPVYGYSHLLGLTAIVPQDVMSEASLPDRWLQ
ncbi:MAG: hypothetical protein IKY66_04685 [Bacteroidales bacterium]|nr:hypothetical protein [Bacteroidales bacterium]